MRTSGGGSDDDDDDDDVNLCLNEYALALKSIRFAIVTIKKVSEGESEDIGVTAAAAVAATESKDAAADVRQPPGMLGSQDRKREREREMFSTLIEGRRACSDRGEAEKEESAPGKRPDQDSGSFAEHSTTRRVHDHSLLQYLGSEKIIAQCRMRSATRRLVMTSSVSVKG